MREYVLSLLIVFVFTAVQAQPTLQDTLSALSHEHTPIFTGSGDESIVCYKSTHRDFFFAITGLIIALALVLLKLFLFNRKTSRMLKSKNEIIEEKNKNITDSINYAKRLQNAILPTEASVNAILPEYFILYQPKDIVSGDFYWVSEHGSKVVIAAVDCTGHGVPGALLSIVGHNALQQTVMEQNILEPAEVLTTMDGLIRKMLHQDGSGMIKDGMDMALCVYDKVSSVLNYCGANNPLYVVSEVS
jgi:serine phosphatase RsbU (regulator of sigma subunit)